MTGPAERTRWIEHRGLAILFYDFSGLDDTDAGLRVIAASRGRARDQPPRSVRTLVDVRGSRFDARITRALQELAREDKPYVLASAVVGVSGLQRVILAAVSRVTRRKFATFDTVDAAKDWLVEQQAAGPGAMEPGEPRGTTVGSDEGPHAAR
jgi:hypothetical protein